MDSRAGVELDGFGFGDHPQMTAWARQPGADAEIIPILLYHSIADVPPPGQQQRFTVSRARFSEHVRALAASGRTAITVSQVGAALRGESSFPDRPVAITFDDGFDDTVEAVDALRDVGLASVVYVTTGNIGTPKGIAAKRLDALGAAGVEIGAHTVSHPHLDEIRLAVAVREISDSRDQLEDRLGLAVSTFAYPHGAHGKRVRRAVIDAGFSTAAAVKNALSHSLDDPFAIARWTVMSDTSTAAIAALLEGRGAPLAWIGERYRTRAHRISRHLRHRIRGALAVGSGPSR